MIKVLRKIVPVILVLWAAILFIVFSKSFVGLDEEEETLKMNKESKADKNKFEFKMPKADTRKGAEKQKNKETADKPSEAKLTDLKKEMASFIDDYDNDDEMDEEEDEDEEEEEDLEVTEEEEDPSDVAKISDGNKQVDEGKKQDSNIKKKPAPFENKEIGLTNDKIHSLKSEDKKEGGEKQDKLVGKESKPVEKKPLNYEQKKRENQMRQNKETNQASAPEEKKKEKTEVIKQENKMTRKPESTVYDVKKGVQQSLKRDGNTGIEKNKFVDNKKNKETIPKKESVPITKKENDEYKNIAPPSKAEASYAKTIAPDDRKTQGKGQETKPKVVSSPKKITDKKQTVAYPQENIDNILKVTKEVIGKSQTGKIQSGGKLDNDKKAIIKKETQIKALNNQQIVDESLKQRINDFKKALEYEEHLNYTKTVFAYITKLAGTISSRNQNSGIILLTFVYEKNIQFAMNWLCNTKNFGIHESVLMVTLDKTARTVLHMNWPGIKTFALEETVFGTTLQNMSTSLRKLQIINSLLYAEINILLFDVNSVWLQNPLPDLKEDDKYFDMTINLVSRSHMNSGFIVLFATEKTRSFWETLYGRLRNMNAKDKIAGGKAKDQDYEFEWLLLSMIVSSSNGVQYHELPISSYTDGIWYWLSEAERQKTRPIVIRNNFIKGTDQKIQRAKLWNHWFLKEDGTCIDRDV